MESNHYLLDCFTGDKWPFETGEKAIVYTLYLDLISCYYES